MADTYTERVIGEVRAEMARQRIGQVKLGKGTGLSQNKLSRRLNGAVPFSTSDLEKIAGFLRVPIGQLADPPVRQAAS
jgi:transcriptional regulator with XRE-family HTH domain